MRLAATFCGRAAPSLPSLSLLTPSATRLPSPINMASNLWHKRQISIYNRRRHSVAYLQAEPRERHASACKNGCYLRRACCCWKRKQAAHVASRVQSAYASSAFMIPETYSYTPAGCWLSLIRVNSEQFRPGDGCGALINP